MSLLRTALRRSPIGPFGPVRPVANPSLKIGDDGVRQLFVGRHLQVVVAIAKCADQQALFGIVRDDGRARIPSFDERRPTVESEIVAGFLAAVAFPASGRQHRANARFKERLAVFRAALAGQCRCAQHRSEDGDQHRAGPSKSIRRPPPEGKRRSPTGQSHGAGARVHWKTHGTRAIGIDQQSLMQSDSSTRRAGSRSNRRENRAEGTETLVRFYN